MMTSREDGGTVFDGNADDLAAVVGGDAKLIAELSEDLGEAMVGINADEIEIIMEERGR